MIPQNAILPLWLAVLCGFVALICWGLRSLMNQHATRLWVDSWGIVSHRTRLTFRWLSVLRTIALMVGGSLLIITALIFIVEAPRG